MAPSTHTDVALTCLGIDGCRTGWTVVILREAGGGAELVLSADVCQTHHIMTLARGAAIVGVDIPIGLLDTGTRGRTCDVEARRLLGPGRASSVFPAPARAWLGAASHAEAIEQARAKGGSAMSIQAFNIAGKVRELDEAIRAHPGLLRRVREVHPEISFLLMNGGRALVEPKTSPAGRARRRRLLARVFGHAAMARLCQARPAGCAEDDLLDATAVAWSARRIAMGHALGVPAAPASDAYGIPMQILA